MNPLRTTFKQKRLCKDQAFNRILGGDSAVNKSKSDLRDHEKWWFSCKEWLSNAWTFANWMGYARPNATFEKKRNSKHEPSLKYSNILICDVNYITGKVREVLE